MALATCSKWKRIPVRDVGGRMPELWTVTSCPVAVHTEWSHCPALFSLFFLPSQIQQTYITKLHCSITGIHYPGRTVAQPYKNLMDRVSILLFGALPCILTFHDENVLDSAEIKLMVMVKFAIDGCQVKRDGGGQIPGVDV